MNLFQWIAIPILGILATLEVRAYIRNHQPIHILREFVWLLGISLILFPRATSTLATLLGIGRGTDLVFYSFMLLSTGGMFYLYGRNYVLRRDIVELIRRDALRNATPGVGLEMESNDRVDLPND
ncbi:MAG: DUF2304 domain-containing protein [Planctomycetota bacterium]